MAEDQNKTQGQSGGQGGQGGQGQGGEQQRRRSAPRSTPPSRERGVQHINDDRDEDMDTTDRVQEAESEEASDEVIVAGEGGLDDDQAAVVAALAGKGVRRSEVARLRDVLDGLLFNKGQVPELPAQPIRVTAGELPVNDDATEELDHAAAVDLIDSDEAREHGLLHYTVRQARNHNGEHYGPRFLRFVRGDGFKDAIRLPEGRRRRRGRDEDRERVNA